MAIRSLETDRWHLQWYSIGGDAQRYKIARGLQRKLDLLDTPMKQLIRGHFYYSFSSLCSASDQYVQCA